MFPAKFTFDATAAPSCASDYVAFNTSLAGVSPTGKAMQGGNMFAATGIPVGTFTISDGAASLVLTAAADNTGNDFLVVDNAAAGPGSNTNAASLAARIVALGGPLGVTATSAGPAVSLAALNFGIEGNNLAVSSTLDPTTFMLGGFFLGGVGRGNIVAFNNLYATQGSVSGFCPQDGPSVYWSYFTGAGSAVTSIVLSLDGSKVAFVETVPGGATLRILQWKALEGAGTGYPVAVDQDISGANWSTCIAGNSCIASIPFSGGAPDTKSSPFYVYGNNADVLYVGDDNGSVHKFTGVFNGTPAEVTTAPWPIPVNVAGTILTSPIFDSVSGNIFVGDSTGRLSYIREVGSTVGMPACTLPCLGTPSLHVGGAGGSIDDAPIVDGTNQTVFAVNGTDATSNGTILQVDTALTAPVMASIGGGLSRGSPIYSGAFDNTYFTGSLGTGHMYICGKQPGVNDRPAIYQLNFTAAGLLQDAGTTQLRGLASNDGAACSPVTEFFNPNGGGPGVVTDWIFFSIGDFANSVLPIPAGGCQINGAGCVMSVDVTNPAAAWPPPSVTNTAPVPRRPAGSTSGIIVDNQADTSAGAFPQASSLYFTLGANSSGTGPGVPSCNTTSGVGCAIKLTQSMLN
jgi:hypothetical protein